jgi:fused signal recognition particle receptor
MPQDPASDCDAAPPEAGEAVAPPPEEAAPEPTEAAAARLEETAAAAAPQGDNGPHFGVLPPRTWFDRLMGVPEAPGAAPPPVQPPPVPPQQAEERRGWLGRLRAGLSRSSSRLNDGINTIFLRRRLDDEALDELEELLIASDMGTAVARQVVEELRRTRFNQEVMPEEVKAALAAEVLKLVEWVQQPLRIDPDKKPFVILVVGVNGSGKTTTIGKLAKQYRDAGQRAMLAAGDTFRAAAVEQLQIWGERAGAPVMTRPTGSDAAGLAYDALVKAREEGADLLLIDTAGRLHNKADLMAELQKIVRVLKKVDAEAPHAVLLVLDATVGQNAHAQAETFRDMVGVTGIVMTKLDGTAKGGVLVSLAEKYGIPIHLIGIGEGAEDLRPFEARAYARSLVGLDA